MNSYSIADLFRSGSPDRMDTYEPPRPTVSAMPSQANSLDESSWSEKLAEMARRQQQNALPSQEPTIQATPSQASSQKGVLGSSKGGLIGINSKKGIDLEALMKIAMVAGTFGAGAAAVPAVAGAGAEAAGAGAAGSGGFMSSLGGMANNFLAGAKGTEGAGATTAGKVGQFAGMFGGGGGTPSQKSPLTLGAWEPSLGRLY